MLKAILHGDRADIIYYLHHPQMTQFLQSLLHTGIEDVSPKKQRERKQIGAQLTPINRGGCKHKGVGEIVPIGQPFNHILGWRECKKVDILTKNSGDLFLGLLLWCSLTGTGHWTW